MLITSAYAQTVATGIEKVESGLGSFLPMIIIFAVLYFVMIHPQMKRQKELRTMLAALAKGDEVVTNGGITGRVTRLADNYVGLEIADNVEITVQKGAIVTVLPKGTLKSL
jgi:preprotein translocase subunit YajC